jgi:hypothetical protein
MGTMAGQTAALGWGDTGDAGREQAAAEEGGEWWVVSRCGGVIMAHRLGDELSGRIWHLRKQRFLNAVTDARRPALPESLA